MWWHRGRMHRQRLRQRPHPWIVLLVSFLLAQHEVHLQGFRLPILQSVRAAVREYSLQSDTH